MRDSPLYTLGFATAVCVVCAVLVSTASVWLRPAQARNRALDRQSKVLSVAGLLPQEGALSASEVSERFEQQVEVLVIELGTGRRLADHEREQDAERRPAPANEAGLVHLPTTTEIYLANDPQGAGRVVLPVEGKGLWSTMYGFLALDRRDLRTIRGIEFYKHGETPGLGGEIDNPRWKARWRGRLAFDEAGRPAIHVAKGAAGPPAQDPYRVDALTGATLTARGVTQLVQFWLSDAGYGPFLERLGSQKEAP